MKKIRTLLVKFDNHLEPWEVPAFRGAVIEKVGREHTLFNNHLSADKLVYRYPTVQYKSLYKHPSIMCLGEGVDEIHKFFNQPSWEVDLLERKMDLTIDQLQLGSFQLKISPQILNYNLKHWFALNTKNYRVYDALSDDLGRMKMLEKVLVGNMLSFAKGMGWYIEEEIKVRITKMKGTKMIKYKTTPLKAFDVEFKTNVSLPYYIGLGKGASKGFGVIYPIHKKTKN